LDATHFRQRAARARELAQSGDDVRLSRMLLDVASDLDAEAEAIEAETMTRRDGPHSAHPGAPRSCSAVPPRSRTAGSQRGSIVILPEAMEYVDSVDS
jgi:hypothetical protein